MPKNPALITPSVIKWARQRSRYSLKVAAKKIRVSPEKLKEWEHGKSLPSMIQARKMSQTYRRPLAVFYLPHPPKGFRIMRNC